MQPIWYYPAMTSLVAEHHRLSDYDFDLPESCIAQEPTAQRDQSRLMTLDRDADCLEHGLFSEIGRCLVPGDILVVNDTKVFPCRLVARKPGNGRAEIFLLNERGRNVWDALVKGGANKGMRLTLDSGIEAEVTAVHEDGVRTVRFLGIDDIRNALVRIGRTPLPPYIKREATKADCDRYQTVFAQQEGAVAAPTAGLHFTGELLQSLKSRGVEVAAITLHVGPGTFQPVRTEVITGHRMLPERYVISRDSAERINQARSRHNRVIAIGTTSVRTLETASDEKGMVIPGEGSSELFIYPGYSFKAIDAMVTNFHLPKSTLLMLVSAFAGRERTLEAYRTAVAMQYRFYSYGDAMLIM